MATWYSDVAADADNAWQCPTGAVVVPFSVSLTTALAAADVIELVKIPNNAVLLDFTMDVTDLDTNATPTLTLDIGDDAVANRFVAASSIGQAGGRLTYGEDGAADTLPRQYSKQTGSGHTDSKFRATVNVAAATPAAGTIKGYVTYTNQAKNAV